MKGVTASKKVENLCTRQNVLCDTIFPAQTDLLNSAGFKCRHSTTKQSDEEGQRTSDWSQV